MSVSVTVHEIGPPSPAVPNPLADLETVRKNANEKLRIRRLVQVRQQSKELAAKVRQNYHQAKVKELAKIEQTRQDELKAWKRKHIRQLQNEYARCIGEVGEAHRAAEAAKECAVWFEEKRATQQAFALQRGRKAEAIVVREREQKDALKEAKARKKQYVPTKSIAIQATMMAPKLEPIAEAIAVTNDDNSTTEATLSPFEQFRAGRKPNGQTLHKVVHDTPLSESEDGFYCPGTADKENIPDKGQDYSATAFTSPSDSRPVELPQRQQLQPFTQITKLIQQRRQQQHHQHRPKDLMVEQQNTSAGLYWSYGTQKTVQFDDLSENTLSFPTSSVLTNDDRVQRGGNEMYPPVNDNSPRMVHPRKLVDQPKVSAVHRIPSVGPAGKATATLSKRGEAVLPAEVRETIPESSSSTSCAASTKVQYYDYNTRYSKEYDQPVAFVHREERRGSQPSAMEEANRYEKLQQELANARSKSDVDRTKPALEKQQTRKDYDKLSKALDNLTRSENRLKSVAAPTKTIPTEAMIKQKAEARQRKANEAIEGLLQQRALVTCPVVRQENPNQRKPRSASRTAVVNVAEIRSDNFAPPNDPSSKNVSTDSCTSIVLGTFERPQIPLPCEDKGHNRGTGSGAAVDKIGKMKELLTQINEQRRLLTEEIAKEKTEPTIPGSVQELCAEMQKNTELDKLERMKRRQEELLEQQRLLQRREREVAELERQLQEKMGLLWQKKQRDGEAAARSESKTASKRGRLNTKPTVPTKAVRVETAGEQGAIEVEVEQPSTSSNSSSQVATYGHSSERSGDVPVKIIITVNDKSTPSKKKHKKKAIKKKSPKPVPFEQAEAKALEVKEKSKEKEPPLVEKLQQEAARPIKVTVRSVEMDFSPGSTSTTSTVYRALPPKIGSLKINSLLPAASPESSKAAHNEAPKEQRSHPKHQLLRKTTRIPTEKPSQASAGVAAMNPHLLKYIVRLLGMSRQSIDQLGVSSTSVSTPNASVVDVSGNVGGITGPSKAVDEIDRMHRLRTFIDENYNFLQEIDETLKRSDHSTLGSADLGVDSRRDSVDDADVSRVADVWMQTLRSRERNMKKQVERQGTIDHAVATTSKLKTKKKRTEKPDDVASSTAIAPSRTEQQALSAAPAPPAPIVPSIESNVPGGQSTGTPNNSRIVAKEASLKSILKSPKRDVSPKVAKIITPLGHVEVINLSDREEQEILERYSQLTERCSQRITELSQMINQVREEKRRLIEDSLSSLDQQESTKYMDLPVAISAETQLSHSLPRTVDQASQGPAAAPAVLPTGGLVQLDDPASEEIDNIFSSKQIGLSKDSGIAMSRPLTASDIRESPYEECSQGKEPLPFEPFLKDIHKPATSMVINVEGVPAKLMPHTAASSVPRAVGGAGARKPPPVAIARFSPQLDEVPAHELSTILEVETPTVAASSSKLNDMTALSAACEPSDTAKEMVLLEVRNKLLEEPVSPDIGYDRFPKYDDYVRAEGGVSLVRVDLENTETATNDTRFRLDLTEERQPGGFQYRSFPVPAPPFDITEDDSRSKIGVETSNSQSNVSDASLPDVVAELKKLNITLKPFNQSLDNSNRSTPLSEAVREKANVHAVSGKKRGKADEGSQDQRTLPATNSMDKLSDLLGNDLENVFGMRWASSMLKKNQQKQQQQLGEQGEHSSSSSLSLKESKGRNNQNATNDNKDDTLTHGGSGKPPILAELIARELIIRTQSDLQSVSSSSELSSSPHSALLKSLLNISNLEHTSNDGSSPAGGGLLTHTTAKDSRNNVHRTSTPVAGKSSASAGSSWRLGTDADTGASRTEELGNLFSSESRISSVHWSSSSGSSEKHALSAPDVRLERQPLGFNQEPK